MKYFSLSKLKNKSFTPAKALNEVLTFQIDNLKSTQKDVDLLLNDIEKLREGMTYKNEELKRKIEDTKPTQCTEDFDKFESQFKNKKISEVASIKHILDKHAYLEELKMTNRVVYVLREIDKGNKDIVTKLLENEDEWQFLCKFLQISIRLTEDPELQVYLKSMQIKTDEKLIKSFERAFAKRDKMTMKKCYEALRSVNRQEIVVKSFMYLLPLFKEDNAKYEEPTEIELEGDIEIEYFMDYIDHVEESILSKCHEFIPIFVDYEMVLETVCKKLYESVVVYNRLQEVLNTKNFIIYILNLKACYLRVQKLSESISSISPDIKTDDFFDELFSPFIQTAIDKEKAAFEAFFDLIARKKDTGTKLLLHGELLIRTEPHPSQMLSKLIKLYSEALNRSRIMNYPQNDIYDYKSFALKKLKELITISCSNFTEPDRLKLIKQLCDIYLIIKKIFKGDDQFYDFKYSIEDRIEIIFNSRIEESEAKYKHLIKKLTIKDFENDNTAVMLKLCDNIRRDSKLCSKYINGTNKEIFMTRLMEYTQTKLYEVYLSFTYSNAQSKVFVRDMNMINELVKEMNLASVFGMFEHLVDISEMVECKKDDVIIYVNILQHKIPHNQIKKVLKSRSDYNEVKKHINK